MLYFSLKLFQEMTASIELGNNNNCYNNYSLAFWKQGIIFRFTNLKIADYYEQGVAKFVQCFVSKILLFKNDI